MITRKPAWFNKKLNLKDCHRVKRLMADLNLNTVCKEANCPNMTECFSMGEATFLILGDICTRGCMFCNVSKGSPSAIDYKEPERIGEAVIRLGLKHVVITSVTRDDLIDGGAEIFAKIISVIHNKTGLDSVTIEVLIPDFKGDQHSIEIVGRAGPDIIGHNIETVPCLYEKLRQGADYLRSLNVLKMAKENFPDIYTKSGLMLGLGEKEEEVVNVFSDLRKVNCDFLSIGQYLAPSRKHHPVKEYIDPQRFDYYQKKAEEMGFGHVVSGPYVRSSYKAGEYIKSS